MLLFRILPFPCVSWVYRGRQGEQRRRQGCYFPLPYGITSPPFIDNGNFILSNNKISFFPSSSSVLVYRLSSASPPEKKGRNPNSQPDYEKTLISAQTKNVFCFPFIHISPSSAPLSLIFMCGEEERESGGLIIINRNWILKETLEGNKAGLP